MSNLRQMAITDLKDCNIRDWSLPIVLIAPNGKIYNTDAETNEELKALQIVYDRRIVNPENGDEIIVKEPVISIALSSLAQVPKDGEKWGVRFPLNPMTPNVLSTFMFIGDHAIEGGESLGFIRIYPQKAEQSA